MPSCPRIAIEPCHALPLPRSATPQELDEVEERLRARTGELDAARTSAEAADERAAEAEARARDMYEENKRLSEHISVGGGGSLPAGCAGCRQLGRLFGWYRHLCEPAECYPCCVAHHCAPAFTAPPFIWQDLESRKRAPLYQKKQEEELKAAQDKAAEAEIRAGEAELKYKEARVSVCVCGCWRRRRPELGAPLKCSMRQLAAVSRTDACSAW